MAEFDKSKHPRDEHGKFTNGVGATEYRQNTPYEQISGKLISEKAYGFASKERKETAHHKAHAQEMGFKNQDEYEIAACKFFNSNVGELYYSERRKRFYRYDKKTKRMCVSSDGIIHTFMLKTEKEFDKTINGDRLKWIK